ncbi:hypothetical protein EB796_018992 [Bugula neritina]|uniref:Uncharacterized protein n=1 Tax=Bugula neritina TaxID=10212 RepID=A0A7J7JAL7_BUGNE|nr:hypothetical protein EB796_018992 [Bugula neritina]
MYDERLEEYDSLKAKYCTSAVEYGNEIFYLDEWNGGKVKTCSMELADIQSLFDFDIIDQDFSRLSVNRRYIALTRESNMALLVFDRIAFCIKHCKLQFKPVDIRFYFENNILVVSKAEGLVVNYKVNNFDNLVELWRYYIHGACNVCTDVNGYIFVGSSEKRVIHVLSPFGKT